MKKPNGFTLIELLVAVSILAILSAVGLVSFQSVRNRANEAKIRADLDAIRKAYEQKFDPSLNGGQGGYKELSPSQFANNTIPSQPNGSPYPCSVGPDPAPGTNYGCTSPNISQGYKVNDGTTANIVKNTGGTSITQTTTCSKFTGTSQSCMVWKQVGTNAVPCGTSTIYINCSDIGLSYPTVDVAIDCSGADPSPYARWKVPFYYTQEVGGTAIPLNPGGQDNTIWKAAHTNSNMLNTGCSSPAQRVPVTVKLHTPL